MKGYIMKHTTALTTQNLLADSKAVLNIASAATGILYGTTKMVIHGAAEVARDQLGSTVDAGIVGGFSGGDRYAQKKLIEFKESLLTTTPTPTPDD
jgi:hypothetical protein